MSILGQFQFRRDLASSWATVNPVLLEGELGIESDTDLFKLGDGVTSWNGLPYGGLQGEAGQASQTIVGATTVINPNQNPSVTDVDAGPNADLRFSLPRAREVIAQTTNTVSPGTAASVTQALDAEGDVLLTFNIPRGAQGWSPLLSVVTDGERRVLRLVDYVGGEGTKPTIPTDNYIGATGLTNLANAVNIRGATGAIGPAGQSVAVSDEGTQLTSAATSINFTGAGITATNTGSSVTVNVPAATLPTPNTLVLRDATGAADFSIVDVTEFFQRGVTNGFVKQYGSGFNGANASNTTYNIARINFTEVGQHTVLRGAISAFGNGVRTFNFIASIRATGNNGITKEIRYVVDTTEADLSTDLGSVQIYNNPTTGDCFLTHTAGGTAGSSVGVSWSFESMERGANRQHVFMENAQTVLDITGLTLVAPYVDPTGRVFSERLVAPRFTGNIVGDAATYGTPVSLGSTNAQGSALTFSRSDHVHAFPSAANVGALGDSGANGIVVRTAANTTTVRAITAGTGITVANGDGTGGSPTVTNADRGTTAVTAHEAAADPHPQYTTTAEAAAAAPVQSIVAGTGISVSGSTGNVTVNNADRGTTAVTNHEAAADPHPQYTTTAEAAAAAPVQSVNGQTGDVTVAAGTNNTAVTRSTPTASASTALTTIQSYPVAAGEIVAGSEYEFYASLRVINTTTATNAVITISVGATNVLVLTQALGTTAAAAPGAAVTLRGRITFSSATQAECEVHAFKQAAVAFTALANTSAPVTVAASGATTIDLKFNTSGATSTFIARQASIHRVK